MSIITRIKAMAAPFIVAGRKHREMGRRAAMADISKYGISDAEDWLAILERDQAEPDMSYAAGYREVLERARLGADIIGGEPSNLRGN